MRWFKGRFALILCLGLAIGLLTSGLAQAEVTINGPFLDEATQGDWRGVYGDCFFLLPNPDLTIEDPVGPELFSENPSQYKICKGGSLDGATDFRIFREDVQPSNAFTWWQTGAFAPAPDGAQWNPCVSDFKGATWDSGDNANGIIEPLVLELNVDFVGSFRIAYYFVNAANVCRQQGYKLTVMDNGVPVTKEGEISDFAAGKYVVFDIDGLEGETLFRFETWRKAEEPDCVSPISTRNSHLSGVFISDCEAGEDEGCTPGYWKQEQHFDSWVGYSPGDDFGDVFGCPITIRWSMRGKPANVSDPTLLQALQAKGGGKSALARHAVAALLNTANPDVSYPRTEEQIMTMVCDALPDGDIEGTKNRLAGWNEEFCPLD